MDTIKVLDHGYVRLVDSMGDDLSIVRAARVSYDAAWRSGEDSQSDTRLINYLLKNNHTSPFEAVTFTFEVYAPIFVFRQWHRHRTWSYNELSGRYRELDEVFYVPDPKLVGTQSKKNKQQRDFDNEPRQDISDHIWMACKHAFKQYRILLEMGAPRELARSVLPVATYSHMFASVDLHNLFHFIRLRAHSHAQHEIQVYALAMLRLIERVVPVAVQAFKSLNNMGANDAGPRSQSPDGQPAKG